MKCTECEDGRWHDASHGCSRKCNDCDGTGQRPDKTKREPVRTSFDRVFPGMPPAVKLSA